MELERKRRTNEGRLFIYEQHQPLQTILGLCNPKKYLAKPRSQVSTKYLQNRIIIFCTEF
jgi:hypothetical protein